MTDRSAGGPWPVEIRVRRAERALEVDFDDGTSFRYPAELLRVESSQDQKRNTRIVVHL